LSLLRPRAFAWSLSSSLIEPPLAALPPDVVLLALLPPAAAPWSLLELVAPGVCEVLLLVLDGDELLPLAALEPALTSLLLMTSTSTLGLALAPELEDEVDGAEADGVEVDGDELDGEVGLVLLDCAHAEPNAPITAAAVILTARSLSLIVHAPFTQVMP
jgi:hypothetical protein